MAAREGGLREQSALLTNDKDGHLWVVAPSSCLPQESLSIRQDKIQDRQWGFREVGTKRERDRVQVLNGNQFVFTEIFSVYEM